MKRRKKQPLSIVYHVGSLSSIGRKISDFSYEGNGLSVSQCPDEWRKIAKLGGNLYILEKDNPNFFMAYEDNRERAIQWCVDNGYLVIRKKYRTYLTDEEGDEQFFEFDRRELAEAESRDEFGDDVREVDGYAFGKKGRAYWKSSFNEKIDNSLAESFAVIFYAEAHDYDGVWWNEDLDVGNYSAPRGVIFQHKISEWKITKTE